MSHDITEGRVACGSSEEIMAVCPCSTAHSAASNSVNRRIHEALKTANSPGSKIAILAMLQSREVASDKRSPGDPPAKSDWNLWKGPAVIDQSHGNYVHNKLALFWETGNGPEQPGDAQLDWAGLAIRRRPGPSHPRDGDRVSIQLGRSGKTPHTMFAVAEYPMPVGDVQCPATSTTKGYTRISLQRVYRGRWQQDHRRGKPNANHRPWQGARRKLKLDPGEVTPGGNWPGAFISPHSCVGSCMANGKTRWYAHSRLCSSSPG